MANTVTNPESYVTLEGRNIVLSFERTGPTTGVVSWTLPKTTNAYDGALVLSSTRDFNPSNMPTDGVKYNPSTDLSNPNNTIGLAKVIGAFYGDKTTNTISLTGLVDGIDYFFALHLVCCLTQEFKTLIHMLVTLSSWTRLLLVLTLGRSIST